jgi:hypothetical protein
MKKYFISLLVSLSLIFNASCVHVASSEIKRVEEPSDKGLTTLRIDGTKVDYLVYHPSQLPLNDFFSRLKRGDYKEAFKKIDLRYRPKNYSDEVMTELLDEGFVPVYVKVKNEGAAPVSFDEKSFTLKYNGSEKKAFYSEYLPKEFEHFNPKAVAANVYNGTLVIVGFAAVLAVVIMGHGNMPSIPGGSSSGSGGGGGSGEDIYNNVSKKVRVDYKNYLISKTELKPGEEAKGLLFFNIENDSLPLDAQIVFTGLPVEPAKKL